MFAYQATKLAERQTDDAPACQRAPEAENATGEDAVGFFVCVQQTCGFVVHSRHFLIRQTNDQIRLLHKPLQSGSGDLGAKASFEIEWQNRAAQYKGAGFPG